MVMIIVVLMLPDDDQTCTMLVVNIKIIMMTHSLLAVNLEMLTIYI